MTRTRAVPDVSVRRFLASRSPPRLAWAGRDGLELAGQGAAVRIAADGDDRFTELRRAATELFADVDHDGPHVARPRLLGGVSFDAVTGDRFEPTASESDDAWADFPPALFVLPRLQLVRTDDRTWLSATEYGEAATPDAVEERLDAAAAELASAPELEPPIAPGVERTAVRPDREAWTGTVADVVERIAAGALEKVVLATAMDVDLATSLDALGALERLRETYPECYSVLVQPSEDAAFFGPPPERLVKVDGTEVRTEALAGSIGRGETPAEDEERADRLRSDEKRRHEQQLVVDAISECLERFGDVTEHERTVRKLATIQHLRTPITASLTDPTHVLDVVAALHPTPAVGGLPRERALSAIRDAESFDRGWYAAPVGWIDAAGDGEFTVAIRTGVARGDRARLFAGNGIVADSDPDVEWAEIEPKFRPVLDALR